MRRAALHVLFLAVLAASGTVVGFCAGGFLGRGGHDLGLGALFRGAAVGFALAAGFGTWAVWGLSPRDRLRIAVGAPALAAVAAVATWAVVQRTGW